VPDRIQPVVHRRNIPVINAYAVVPACKSGPRSRGHVWPLSFCLLPLPVFDVSVTPKSNRCPPVTSCFGIRSSRRINFSFFGLAFSPRECLVPTFFLFFGASTFPFCYQYSCQIWADLVEPEILAGFVTGRQRLAQHEREHYRQLR
jgi:hypothetical protein